ncbi:MAG: response regulator [Deltaproteobacteria bacterium]|jgi:CheY-like chemotaxis protein|nr:response regulator [Deltaproteobacteria bacterium]
MSFFLDIKKYILYYIYIFIAFLFIVSICSFTLRQAQNRQLDLFARQQITALRHELITFLELQEDALLTSVYQLSESVDRFAPRDELSSKLFEISEKIKATRIFNESFLSLYGVIDGNMISHVGQTPLVPASFGKLDSSNQGSSLRSSRPNPILSLPKYDSALKQAYLSVSAPVFDSKNLRRGNLTIDFLLPPIITGFLSSQQISNSFGFLADQSGKILSYPEPVSAFTSLYNVPGFENLKGSLEDIHDNVLIKRLKVQGTDMVAFFGHLPNGWLAGIFIPAQYFDQPQFSLYFLAALGVLIALAFISWVVWRILGLVKITEQKKLLEISFLSKISFEIRNPMNSIVGFSELAERDFGRSEGHAYITEIRKAAQKLVGFVEDISNYALIESGRLTLAGEPYRTEDFLNSLIVKTRSVLRDKGLVFLIDVDRTLPKGLIGDVPRIQQVLLNLIGKLSDYSREGLVKLSIKVEPLSLEETRVIFILEGSGLNLAEVEKVKVQRDLRGLGQEEALDFIDGRSLRLSICKTFCQLMGGDLSFESQGGRNFSFTALIVQGVSDSKPLGEFTERQFEQFKLDSAEGPSFTAPDYRVLVVDDMITNLTMASALLEPFEIKVSTVSSGLDAVDVAQKTDFDLFLIDLTMPGLNGVETLERIRNLSERNLKVPAVAFTANVVDGIREELLELGFDDYISKPVESNDFNALLERWVPTEMRRRPSTARSPVSSKDKSAAIGSESIMIPSQLNQLPGFDPALGLSRCGGSQERYLKILKVFLKDIDKMAKEITAPDLSTNEEELSLLTIKFHAIKSSAASVGAYQCSEEAKILERDSRTKDLSLLSKDRVEGFTASLTILASRLREILGVETKMHQASGNLDKQSIADLRQALTIMNVRRADNLVEELTNQANRPQVEILEGISNKILMAEFSEALELVDKLEATGSK